MIFKDPVWCPSSISDVSNSEDYKDENELNMKLNSKKSVRINESKGST